MVSKSQQKRLAIQSIDKKQTDEKHEQNLAIQE